MPMVVPRLTTSPTAVNLSKDVSCFALVICPLGWTSTCQSLYHNKEERWDRGVSLSETSIVVKKLVKCLMYLDNSMIAHWGLQVTRHHASFKNISWNFLLYPAISLSFLSFDIEESLYLLPVLSHFSNILQFCGNNHMVPPFLSSLEVLESTRERIEKLVIQHETW